MKRAVGLGIFFFVSSVPSWGASQTLTGQITDSMCGTNHASMGEMGKNAKTCTAGCVKASAKYAFVSNGKVYGIPNQNFGSLAANAGGTVEVTGDVDKDGKNITISKISPKK